MCCLLALPGLAGASEHWRQYAQRSIAPDFDWAQTEVVAQTQPTQTLSLRDATREALASWRGGEGWRVDLSSSRGTARWNGPELGLLAQGQSSFNFGSTNTTLRQPLGDRSMLALTAIVARGRFATPGMGASPWHAVEQFTGVRQAGVQEVSEGGAVELAMARSLNERLLWTVSVQSRLDMDPFKNYHGIYSEAGDFDLPGHVRTGLEWAAGSRFTVAADVQRVMYGDVQAFSTLALPTRLLALLGDGDSPQFAWRDLMVYSAEAAVHDDFGGRWSLRYSTQQQPKPTSELLSRALSEQYSDLNIGLGYRRNIGRAGYFQMAASYAPAAYFMASMPFVQRDFDGGSQVEVEAQWAFSF